jgi:class 3 adenylate cyclase
LSRVARKPESERGRSGEPSEIKTFLISDIRGYARFSQEHGDAAAARLTGRFAEVASEAVEAREAPFALPSGCRRSSPARSADPTLPLLAGVGLDAGEVVPIAAGYRGRALNLAARLCARASGGQILATGQVIHLAGQVDGALGP